MVQTNLVEEPQGEGLDADAVCSQCHTVNADGVLICKVCGNNLRDQRRERLGEEELLFGAEKGTKRKFLIRALGVLGFLLVVWTAINANHVAEWAVRVSSGTPPDGRILWQGEDAATFDALRAEIEGLSPAPAQMRRAMNSNQVSMDYTGRYVLLKNSDIIGYAVARPANNLLYAVGLTLEGVEVRCKLQQDGLNLSLLPGGAAIRTPRSWSTLVGQIYQDDRGVLRIGGRDEYTGQVYTCSAYRLPLQ